MFFIYSNYNKLLVLNIHKFTLLWKVYSDIWYIHYYDIVLNTHTHTFFYVAWQAIYSLCLWLHFIVSYKYNCIKYSYEMNVLYFVVVNRKVILFVGCIYY